MLDGLQMATDDEYLMDLMRHENVSGAVAAMADADRDAVRIEFWHPILEHGRRRGELRDGLTDAQIVRWFGAVQLTFLENRELYPDLASVAAHVETFVVPSVLARTAPRRG